MAAVAILTTANAEALLSATAAKETTPMEVCVICVPCHVHAPASYAQILHVTFSIKID